MRRILTIPFVHYAVPCLLLASCASTGELKSPGSSFSLAHNTERTLIMDETSRVLSMYNFILELNDAKRDRGALQTFWRTNDGIAGDSAETKMVTIRDRAFLHISPRGKNSIQYNAYQMVNATLEFEVQIAQGGGWVDITPSKELQDQYKDIVRDVRNRMLRYQNEF